MAQNSYPSGLPSNTAFISSAMNTLSPVHRVLGEAAPRWFDSRYTTSSLRLWRAIVNAPRDIADSLFVSLYANEMNNAVAAKQFGRAFTIENHEQIIDLVIEPALAYVQERYTDVNGGYHRLPVNQQWRLIIESEVDASVRHAYRRDANLLFVCETVGALFSLSEYQRKHFKEFGLGTRDGEWERLIGHIETLTDALVVVYGYLHASEYDMLTP